MKWRNSKERELLASGGSRDQTLPNKNNPNPDLSDARNDRAPSLSPPSSPTGSPQSSEQFANNQSPHKQPIDGKFLSDTASSPHAHSNKELFKYEFDDNRQTQMFNQFYDKNRDVNGVNYGGICRTNSSNLYYDEFDSHSDSDEEISVT